MSRIPEFLTLFLLTVQMTLAADAGWDERLARVFSGRLKEIESELKTLFLARLFDAKKYLGLLVFHPLV